MKKDLLEDIAPKCYWDKERSCTGGLYCDDCAFQPSDDDKKNGKAEPVHINWIERYGELEPECPSCGEMPYSMTRCVFCGQSFLPDKTAEEWSKPPEEVRMDCMVCGGKKTLVGLRARCNGHFRGTCEKCGTWIIE